MSKAKTEKKKQKVAGYRILSVLFLILAVGGLFIGLLGTLAALGKFAPFLSHAELYGNEGTLGGSLIGLFISYIGTFKQFFSLLINKETFQSALTAFNCSSYGQLSAELAKIVFMLFCLLAALFSLLCFIAAMASRKSARGAAMFSGIFTVFSYGGLFLLNYAYNCSNGSFTRAMFDFPTAIIAGVALILLVVTALLRNKGTGIIAVITTACTLGILFALCYPGYQTAQLIGKTVDGSNRVVGLLDYMKQPGYTFCVIATLILLCLVGVNLFFSLCRFNAKKGFGFDVFRFLLLLLAAILTVVALIAMPFDGNGPMGVFQGMGKIIPTVVIIVAALIPFILYIIRAKVKTKKKKKPSQTTAQAHVETIKGKPAIEHSYRDDNEEDEIRRILAVEARNRTVYVPVYTPGSSINEEEEKSAEKTEFEKRMEAIARGEKLNEEPVELAAASTEAVHAAPLEFTFRPKTSTTQTYNSEQYNEDPFMRTLSDDEKTEFASEFIANAHGVQNYLPAYIVGSYNEEFFMKVFNYLGRYHIYVSEGLLVKLSNYVSLLRSQR